MYPLIGVIPFIFGGGLISIIFREFVEGSHKIYFKEKYDNIYLAMVMTNAIENTMYSLSENYLFTEEAFKEYFNKLSEDGKLSFMPHDAFDMARVVNTGIKVWY